MPGRASAGFSLHGAVYEFQLPEALAAIAAAAKNADAVSVIYDGIDGSSGPKAANEEAIATAKIKRLCIARTTGKMMHNKFFVLSKGEDPIAVWTGSTNLTENGVYGHLNCGHIVEDPTIAAAYLEYWKELKGNPASADERQWMADNNPAPPDPNPEDEHTVVFSPRKGLDVLEWYAKISASAKQALMMTFAFGMHQDFQDVYEQDDSVLRFVLMENEGNGAGLAKGKQDIRRIRARPNVVVAVGNNITTNSLTVG